MQRTLKDLAPGERGIVRCVRANESIRRRLLDIGLIEGTMVECVGRSPLGDPKAYLFRDAVVAIRGSDGAAIEIEGAEATV